MTLYEDMAELVRVGAYKAGTNPEVDHAVMLHPLLEAFLAQKKDEQAGLSESYAALGDILNGAEKGRA
jgi:flagellum-specific ATP synthase